MRAADLPQITALSSPSLHPSGDRVVVAATRPDFIADSYVGQLWSVPVDGSPPRRITRGFRDSQPAFSPDGRLIGFLRSLPGKPAQLAIVDASGGEPMIITDAPLGVCEFAFSADSSQLAFIAAVPEPGRHGTTPGVDAAQEDPRRISTVQFHEDGRGFVAGKRRHVFVIDVPDPSGEPPVAPVGRAAAEGASVPLVPTPRQLSTGDVDHNGLAWAADAVISIAARHEGHDRDQRSDLYRFSPGTDEPVRLTYSTSGPSALGSPVTVGDQVYFVGIDAGATGLDLAGVNACVCAVATSGGAVAVLTDAETVCIEGGLVADGDGVLAIDQVRGSGQVIRVGSAGETHRWVVAGSASAAAAAGETRVAIGSTPTSPSELFALSDPGRPLTAFGASWAESVVVPSEQTATAPDGYPVHGWVLRPDADGPRPVVLMIHGGPFAAYSGNFFDEAQVLAGAGYAVLMCNPRGSAGYGQAHGRVLKGAMGDLDMVDVLSFLEHCLANVAGLDAARVGVMGGSYGGYLAAWLIAHTHVFAGAIVERGYLDGRAMIGASDIGWFFGFEYHGTLAEMDRRSPLYQVHRVQTPTLVIHSEQDLRCPLGVAERYYTELLLRGVEAELLVFPGEGHELSRSGTPHHRRARFEHVLDWWDKHLR